MTMDSLGALFQPVGRGRLSPSVEQQVKDSLSTTPPDSSSPSGLSAMIPMRLIPDEKRFAGLVMGGAPAWAVRLKKIETLTDTLLSNLHDRWVRLAYQHRHQPELFAEAWREH